MDLLCSSVCFVVLLIIVEFKVTMFPSLNEL